MVRKDISNYILTSSSHLKVYSTFYSTFLSSGLSAGTGKLCIFGHLGLVFIWSCFVSCLLLLLYYVICAPVLTGGTLSSLSNKRQLESHPSFLRPIFA